MVNMETITDVPMNSFVESVFPFRQARYKEDLIEKLFGEGIASPSDLLRVSSAALESKLLQTEPF